MGVHEDGKGEVVVYQGSGEWSAVYLGGQLERVGDHYLADEWVREHFGVKTVQSDDFMRGGDDRSAVAPTTLALEAYRANRASRMREAANLRERAAVLLREAQGLEDE